MPHPRDLRQRERVAIGRSGVEHGRLPYLLCVLEGHLHLGAPGRHAFDEQQFREGSPFGPRRESLRGISADREYLFVGEAVHGRAVNGLG